MYHKDVSYISTQDLEQNYALKRVQGSTPTHIKTSEHQKSYHCLDEVREVVTAYENLRKHPELDELSSSDAFAQLLEIAQGEPQRSFKQMGEAFCKILHDTLGEIQTTAVLMQSWLKENS